MGLESKRRRCSPHGPLLRQAPHQDFRREFKDEHGICPGSAVSFSIKRNLELGHSLRTAVVEVQLYACREADTCGYRNRIRAGAEAVLDGFRAPAVKGDVFGRAGELELRWDVVGPERPALGAERACALRHCLRRFGHFECCRFAVAASLDGHGCHLSVVRRPSRAIPEGNRPELPWRQGNIKRRS